MIVLANQNEWATKPLIDVATLKRGYDLPVQDRTDGPHPIFAANGIVGSHLSAKSRGPGVVTGRSGTIGKVHFIENDFWPLNTSLYVTDFHGNDPKWVYYMLQSLGLERFSQGASVPTLNRNLIHGMPIKVPIVSEQRRIAAVLDQTDSLRAKRRETLVQLENLTQSIFVEMFGDPVRNPKLWKTLPLSECSAEINDCPHSTPIWTESGEICLRTSNLTKGDWKWEDTRYVSSETFNTRSKRGYVVAGDIILSREGTVGIAAVVTCEMKVCMGQRLVQIRPDFSKFTSDFLLRHLLFVLSPSRIGQSMVGSTSQHLNVKELKSLKIPLPPVSLQLKFSERCASIDRLKKIIRESVAELDSAFASIQHRAFRGEL